MSVALENSVLPDIQRPYSAEELLRFPASLRYELIKGQLRPMAPTGDFHGSFTYDLGFEIGAFVRQNNLGRCFAAETGFLLRRDPDTVKAPDFAFISRERLTFPRTAGFVPVVPDLVLETRSPSDRNAAVAEKIHEWLDAGVRMALDLDPAKRTLRVYCPGIPPQTLTPNDTLQGGEVLPGFSLPLQRLFAA